MIINLGLRCLLAEVSFKIAVSSSLVLGIDSVSTRYQPIFSARLGKTVLRQVSVSSWYRTLRDQDCLGLEKLDETDPRPRSTFLVLSSQRICLAKTFGVIPHAQSTFLVESLKLENEWLELQDAECNRSNLKSRRPHCFALFLPSHQLATIHLDFGWTSTIEQWPVAKLY